MPEVLKGARRIVVKVGSSLVTNEGKGIDAQAVGNWCRQLAALEAGLHAIDEKHDLADVGARGAKREQVVLDGLRLGQQVGHLGPEHRLVADGRPQQAAADHPELAAMEGTGKFLLPAQEVEQLRSAK